ncbi:MAG: formylmethanofuran--tetrahydromethanopterin N-formyltransferase [Candidatus Hodarchaeales archaeon]
MHNQTTITIIALLLPLTSKIAEKNPSLLDGTMIIANYEYNFGDQGNSIIPRVAKFFRFSSQNPSNQRELVKTVKSFIPRKLKVGIEMSKIDPEAYAEGFKMKYTRLLVTAATQELVDIATRTATGYGTSIIGSPSEAGVENKLPESTPDGRPGRVIQIWHSSKKKLANELLNRIGQCLLTAPTTAVFDNTGESDVKEDTGKKIRFFGDGYQKKADVAGREVFEIPVMDGFFVIEGEFGIKPGVAGGNLIITGKDQVTSVNDILKALSNLDVAGVVTPFPGGICRSGSKVGSKYKFLKASTNHRYCPALRDKVDDSLLTRDENCVYEIVLNGISEAVVQQAMETTARMLEDSDNTIRITAANYDGKLGQFKLPILKKE